ncbi:TetR/AcrR family transcriptional regulator [Streptomyces decoyicus]|uniref:TetR/AcrR family transcriptional regulator n=1 Tax=Streptomyces decoyicus TaxID=249567 RepID=UPI0033A628EC
MGRRLLERPDPLTAPCRAGHQGRDARNAGEKPLHPRKQPKQVRGELTRERILVAAAQVFAEYGYAAETTNRIAERAHVSIGSLYQYYPNKDAILVGAVNSSAGYRTWWKVRCVFSCGSPSRTTSTIRSYCA